MEKTLEEILMETLSLEGLSSLRKRVEKLEIKLERTWKRTAFLSKELKDLGIITDDLNLVESGIKKRAKEFIKQIESEIEVLKAKNFLSEEERISIIDKEFRELFNSLSHWRKLINEEPCSEGENI